MDDLFIAVVMFEGAEEQDVVGPYEMFTWMSLFQDLPPGRPISESDFSYDFFDHRKDARTPTVFTVAPTTDTYRLTSGMRCIPDFSYDNAPAANMTVAPGGSGSRDIPALQKNGTIDYIKQIASAPDCQYVMSVCTGAFLLGAAGVLNGRYCQTTPHSYTRFEEDVPNAKLVKDASLNFVQDGNLFTSSGPCSGLATSLRVVEVHCGTGYKNNLRELIEYIPPPMKGALAENGTITTIEV
jgi:transcriptional regulator GlxA family with amidase domain